MRVPRSVDRGGYSFYHSTAVIPDSSFHSGYSLGTRKGKVFGPLLVVLVLLFPGLLEGTKYAGEAFSVGFGARALALGGSFSAVGEDASTIFWNPAGLSYLEGANLIFMHGSYFDGAENQDFVAGSLPDILGKGVPLGVSLFLLSSGGIKSTELSPGDTIPEGENLIVTDTLNFRAYRVTFSGSIRALGGGVGVTLKFIGEDLSVETGWGVGLDIGYLYRSGVLGYGFVVKDIFTTPIFWSSGRQEFISPSFRMGISYSPMKSFLFTSDLIVFTEGRETEAPLEAGPLSLEPHLGLEFQLSGPLSLRGGLDSGNPTLGAGIHFGAWYLDYAFLSHSELGSSHRFSLALRI